MSNSASSSGTEQVVQLKVHASLMTFDAGLFCVFLPPEYAVQSVNGYPAVTVTQAPNMPNGIVTIKTFEDDGVISSSHGAGAGAALVRVARGPAQVMVTTYQAPDSSLPAPGIQVARLSGDPAAAAPAAAPAAQPAQAAPAAASNPDFKPELAAHVQRRGDVLAQIGEWMGEPGSQNWIEGFGIAPQSLVAPEDIEYQAVLGKGWLSPWAEAGQYCGSRGMALPILGLCVRLKNGAEEKYDIAISATFTDGTRIGPVAGGVTLEAESLAPLEAFHLEILPRNGAVAPAAKEERAAKPAKKPVSRRKTSDA
ncbi:hypothetical protein [Asaia bogorensis]|uniref:Clostridial hydrophobic W domain protein n=1 Tax=Asaia bogorensis NBRC 16594 TaxID=1231624 RepID=A0AAN4U2C0_9PROT|nr:hypothetical protein [Asaia bogorensis]BAT18922.1 clostridial hydrophobic W domain protein [Asaia bogorensis NBRC 16594]GBQ73826.1 hypothetical protein AA0311_0320 [Asaia bogorensis NBRC 16594]GEL53277.1 hypothetical protein ABO01nite_12840 [Asaia bogorensis NBRC 16594]